MFQINYILRKNCKTSESLDVAETSCSVLPAIGGAAACATVQKVKLNSDDDSDDSDDEKKENDKNEENGECPALDKDGNVILHDNGNTATIRKGAKVTRNNPDFDSIEELTEPECNFKNSAVDLTDSAICATKKKNRKSKKRKNKNKKLSENSEDEPKNEKIIDCLYVGLMCCECVIS